MLINTLLARNTEGEVPSDCFGLVTSQGHNLIGDPTGCTVTLQAADRTGNPGLGSLVDDDTPGQAHLPLLAGSPAINAGHNAVCLSTDQLGQPRVGVCDIGAIEFQAEPVPSCQGGRSLIRGRIITAEDAVGLSEVVLTLDGPNACQETVSPGKLSFYVFPHLKEGTYRVTPSDTECTFDPPSRTVTIEGGFARLHFAADCP